MKISNEILGIYGFKDRSSNTLERKILIEKTDKEFLDMLYFVERLYGAMRIPKNFISYDPNK